ncbi:MAG: PilW family protein [Bacteroidia bacterium]
MMKKLEAFTLMELLVGMIISSLVISFGYGIYQVVQEQFRQYKTVKTELMQAAIFRSVLENDFFSADEVYGSREDLTINSKTGAIRYEFGREFILRRVEGSIDTFHIASSEIALTPALEESDLLSSCEFDGVVCDEIQHFIFSKSYDAAILMRIERRSDD